MLTIVFRKLLQDGLGQAILHPSCLGLCLGHRAGGEPRSVQPGETSASNLCKKQLLEKCKNRVWTEDSKRLDDSLDPEQRKCYLITKTRAKSHIPVFIFHQVGHRLRNLAQLLLPAAPGVSHINPDRDREAGTQDLPEEGCLGQPSSWPLFPGAPPAPVFQMALHPSRLLAVWSP